MIKFKELMLERKANDKGCLMVGFSKEQEDIIVDFGKKIIPDDILYTAPDDDYGREDEPHTTILFGFTKDLNEMDIRRILKGVKPFTINVVALDKFDVKAKGYDVVILKVESPILTALHQKCKTNYPNEQSFPNYNPHITLAYVKPGTFEQDKVEMNMPIQVTYAFYSPMSGEKEFYDLV